MTTKGFQDILKGIRGAKQVMGEAQGLAPIIRNFLGNTPGNERVKEASNQEIFDAIDFATRRIKEDPYVILGVDCDDPPEMITEVYRVKAKIFHPDGRKPDADKFRKIEGAYRRLKNNG